VWPCEKVLNLEENLSVSLCCVENYKIICMLQNHYYFCCSTTSRTTCTFVVDSVVCALFTIEKDLVNSFVCLGFELTN
jgi:hypothetical protein